MSDIPFSGRPLASFSRIWTAIRESLKLGLHRRASLGRDVRLLGYVWIHGGGKVEIRDRVCIDATDFPVELHAEPEAEIVIGTSAQIGSGTSIEATERVLIGEGVRIGRLCKVLDNSFHETRGDWNQRPPSLPVEIGSGAIIGDRAILLPGAQVKPGQIVAPGAVVRGPRRAAADDITLRRVRPPVVTNFSKDRILDKLRVLSFWLEVLVARMRAFLLFRRKERSCGIRVRGSLRVERGGTLRIGPRVTFLRGMIPTLVAARPGAVLSIGEGCLINYGATLDASVGITLGDQCRLGSMVVLCDDDGEKRAPIVLGDRVWLAHGVTVKPGVRIGSGAVVSAGSVVVKDVLDGAFVAGNPARAGVCRPIRASL